MVCLGNICRSPLAEGILKDKIIKAGLNWKIDSAGTNGYHVGEQPHRLSQKVAKLNGIDISNQQCRKFSTQDFDDFDMIYAMAADIIEDMKHIARGKYDASKVKLLLNEIYPGKDLDVPDPWYGGEDGYHKVYELIDEACNAIVQHALADPEFRK
ncbi:low molecular weight protein-tyrosine-phosphatase [soil metagenome]